MIKNDIEKIEITQNALIDIKERSFSRSYTYAKDASGYPVVLESYGCFYADRKYFTERRGLDSCLLIHTFGGCGMIRTSGGERLLKPGSIVMIDCLGDQYYRTVGSDGWDFRWFHIRGVWARAYEQLVNGNGIYVVPASSSGEIIILIDELVSYAERREAFSDLMLSGKIISVLDKAVWVRNPHERVVGRRGSLDEVIRFIDHKYQERISVDQLAVQAHLSKYHFIRVFKNSTGLTPYEYILRNRINGAKKLLLNTEKAVSEISVICGFSCSNSFIRAFRKICGVTPDSYRKDRVFPL